LGNPHDSIEAGSMSTIASDIRAGSGSNPNGIFCDFAPPIRAQTTLRQAITTACRRPETECLPPLVDAATLHRKMKSYGLRREEFRMRGAKADTPIFQMASPPHSTQH